VWVSVGGVAPYLLPAPSRIAAAFLDSRSLLWGHLLTTTEEAVLGIAVGAVLGALLAVAIASVGLLRRSLYPLLVVTQVIPIVVLAPLLVLWFGFGLTPKVVVVALIVFFPVVVSTVAGLRGVDREMVDLVRSMGASTGQVLRTVLIPAAVPAFFAGLRISAAYAVAGAVIGELVGAQSGLGLFMDRSRASYQVDRIFVAVALIAVLSLALFGLVSLAGRLAAPWHRVSSAVGPGGEGARR
ncbi:MAG: ABC transporter permease, partial [Mycobacteriales bacterium]